MIIMINNENKKRIKKLIKIKINNVTVATSERIFHEAVC